MLSQILPEGRWRLLRSLWMDGASGSVMALAKRNQIAYSSAHAELRRLQRAGLAHSEVVGNSLVYEANRDHPAAEAMNTLVRASDDPKASPESGRAPTDRVLANLKSLGAPLRDETPPADDMSPEDAVAQGLRLTHDYPTLARLYPVLLAGNRKRLNLELLKQRATAMKEKQTLGFFLDLTGILADDPRLRTFARTLRDRRVKQVRDFFEGPQGKYAKQLAEQRTPPVARDWQFRMDMDMDNFRRFYSKFSDDR